MDKRMNIVFILVDQWRSDCLSLSGHPVVETPALDDIAGRGRLFTHAYSPCPSCIAARASMFTGLKPSRHGRLGYMDKVPWNYKNMLAQVLGDHGYQTHCTGKTHFFPQRAHFGFQSMDSYEAEQNHDGKYINDYHEWLRDHGFGFAANSSHGLDSNSWVARPSPLPEQYHNNTWTMDRSLDFLKRRDSTRPFFLNISFHRPHPPIDPPQAFWDMYQNRELPPVPVGDWTAAFDHPITDRNVDHGHLAPHLLDQARRGYYAQIAHIDNQIGRLLTYLARYMPGAGPTAIIFTSDHGEMLGDHHIFRKCVAYEGSAGVPFILHVPGQKQTGPCDAPVTLEDVYSTVLDLAGVPLPEPVDGRSLVPYTAAAEVKDWREFVHGEHTAAASSDRAMQFVTDGREKFVWLTQSGREQFFDLAKDPTELHDASADPAYCERVVLWRNRLIAELAARPQDKLTDGKQLLPGTVLPAVRPELEPEKK